MKKFIVIGAGVVALSSGSLIGVNYYKTAHAAAMAALAARPPTYVEVKTLTVRLADTSAEHYIRLTPVLAVRAADESEVRDHLPMVRDQIFTVVSSLDSTELMKPEGNQKLKRMLADTLSRKFEGVVAIYFDDYLVE